MAVQLPIAGKTKSPWNMSRTPSILAIDQGTTGTTCLVFSEDGRVLGRAYSEFTQHFPEPGWVEHDALEIWEVTQAVAREALASAAGADVRGIGITNQRETIVLWDRETLEPVHRAIVWQDRRTAGLCADLKKAGHEAEIRERTGLLLDPYFSGTKLLWLLRQRPELRARAEAGELAAGTIDTWLIARLTNGEVHATDPTNASRTLLFNLSLAAWDPWLLDTLEIPHVLLPEVRASSGDFGVVRGEALGIEVPVAGVAGDQQAALFGQGCWSQGLAKSTYGTGAFLLMHTGDRLVRSKHGLLTTAACDSRGGLAFALEGSVFIAGAALQWLRDGLGLIDHASESEAMAEGLESNDGVYFVPAFVGSGHHTGCRKLVERSLVLREVRPGSIWCGLLWRRWRTAPRRFSTLWKRRLDENDRTACRWWSGRERLAPGVSGRVVGGPRAPPGRGRDHGSGGGGSGRT